MKIKIAFFSMFILTLLMQFSFAANSISLSINGTEINNEDEVIYQNGILYGKVSDFAKRMSIDTMWLEPPKLYVLLKDDQAVTFGLNTDQIYLGLQKTQIEHETIVIDNHLYASLDALSQYLGFTYDFDPSYLAVNLKGDAFSVQDSELYQTSYTDEDLLWLARIVDVESGDASVAKRIAVANVVLNRVKNVSFPNTIYDVIFASGQFPPAHKTGFDTLVPSEESVIAAKRALQGENNISTALYFNCVPFSSKADDFYTLMEGDYFYY